MPGKTDGPEDVEALLQFCRGKRSMQAIELLPYHLLGLDVSGCLRVLIKCLIWLLVGAGGC